VRVGDRSGAEQRERLVVPARGAGLAAAPAELGRDPQRYAIALEHEPQPAGDPCDLIELELAAVVEHDVDPVARLAGARERGLRPVAGSVGRAAELLEPDGELLGVVGGLGAVAEVAVHLVEVAEVRDHALVVPGRVAQLERLLERRQRPGGVAPLERAFAEEAERDRPHLVGTAADQLARGVEQPAHAGGGLVVAERRHLLARGGELALPGLERVAIASPAAQLLHQRAVAEPLLEQPRRGDEAARVAPERVRILAQLVGDLAPDGERRGDRVALRAAHSLGLRRIARRDGVEHQVLQARHAAMLQDGGALDVAHGASSIGVVLAAARTGPVDPLRERTAADP
jgi:hypothetical protein